MRRSVLLSLMTVVMVATMLGIGSWAVFNDTETAGPYTATAGSLDLDLDTSAVVPAEISDLKPSVPHFLGPFWVHNAGGNPGGLDLHFMNVVDGQGTQTEPEAAAEWGGPIFDLSNWIDIDYWRAGPYTVAPGAAPPTVTCGSGPTLGKLADIESTTFDLGVVAHPSEWYAICISFHLDTFAGNEYQGDTSSFELEFTLHQLNLGTLGLPIGTECVRLENKSGAPAWAPIVDDDLYGSVCYGVAEAVGSDLEMSVLLNGLAPDTWHQLTLNGQGGDCDATDDQLASGSEQFALFDSGFWPGNAPALDHGACAAPNAEGVYNFAYVKTDASGNYSGLHPVANSGESDPAGSGNVTAANPALPVGVYGDVKFLVKEVETAWAGPPSTPPWPGTYTPVLTEMATLDFNLP